MSEMAPLAERMLMDMRSKDLEVYVTNPQVEKLLTQMHADGSVNTQPGTDGFLLVQSNTSVSKATNFVKVTQRDNVTLDAKGGATHHLTLTFTANYVYNQVYGYLTYRDYLRIYVPPQSKLLSANGFDTGKPLCWAPYAGYGTKEPALFKGVPLCSGNPYTQGELVCPSGSFAPGPQSPFVSVAGVSALLAEWQHPVGERCAGLAAEHHERSAQPRDVRGLCGGARLLHGDGDALVVHAERGGEEVGESRGHKWSAHGGMGHECPVRRHWRRGRTSVRVRVRRPFMPRALPPAHPLPSQWGILPQPPPLPLPPPQQRRLL